MTKVTPFLVLADFALNAPKCFPFGPRFNSRSFSLAMGLKRPDRTHPVKAVLMADGRVVIIEEFGPGNGVINIRLGLNSNKTFYEISPTTSFCR